MKVKVISRDDEDFFGDTSTSLEKEHSEPSSVLHKFEHAREVQRAVNAAKVQRMQARPFVGDLSGHQDTPQQLCFFGIKYLLSASADGEIRIWDIAARKTIYNIPRAHNGLVTGLICEPYDNENTYFGAKSHFYTISNDKHLKRWNLDILASPMLTTPEGELLTANMNQRIYKEQVNSLLKPTQSYVCEYSLNCIDSHVQDNVLATGSSERIDVWDSQRCIIKQSFDSTISTATMSGIDNILSIRFNKVQSNLLGLTSRDRAISIYDIKSGVITSKFLMRQRSNSICFNPMNPFHFSIANEDNNCYTFDMRKLDKGPMIMHTGHTNAVLSVDYSPKGDEFVSGSYDKSLRIFRVDSTHYKSREIYHTARMKRVFKVQYSPDANYIFSASDDHGIRIWKNIAWQPLRPVSSKKEAMRLKYHNQLVERHKDIEQIRSINEHRHLPNEIYQNKKISEEKLKARVKKARNYVRYTTAKKLSEDGPKKIEKQHVMKRNFLGLQNE